VLQSIGTIVRLQREGHRSAPGCCRSRRQCLAALRLLDLEDGARTSNHTKSHMACCVRPGTRGRAPQLEPVPAAVLEALHASVSKAMNVRMNVCNAR
jgi:hypothetical protein